MRREILSRQNLDPIALGADCANCPYAKDGKPTHPVFGVGPSKPVGIAVGEGPGAEETETGTPFSGNTGRELDEELRTAGLPREQLFIGNVTACQPIMKSEGRQRQATNCCRLLIQHQLARFPKTTPVLAMGKWAAFGLTGKDRRIMSSRGFVRQAGLGTLPNPLIVTWHPTYAFYHNPYEWGAFTCDLQRFKRLCTNTLRPGPERLETNPTLADIALLVKLPAVSIDIETAPETEDTPWTGKDPTRCRLRTMGMGISTWGLSFQWDTASPEMKTATARLLADPKIIKVTQNGPWFDHRVLLRYGMKVVNWDDIRERRKAIAANGPLSLAYMTSLYDDAPPWKENDEDDEKGLVLRAPRTHAEWAQLQRYNAEDCVHTHRDYEAILQEPEWQEQRAVVLWEQRKRTAVIAARMHTNGILVTPRNTKRKPLPRKAGQKPPAPDEYIAYSRKGLGHVLRKLYFKRERLFLKKVRALAMKAGTYTYYFNQVRKKSGRSVVCCPTGMRALMFASKVKHAKKDPNKVLLSLFNLPDPGSWLKEMWTKTGEIAVDQQALLLTLIDPKTADDLKVCIKMYWEAESVWKARSTFVVSAKVSQAIGKDGRLRAGWNSCGTDTDRWSCGEPNLMNLSEKKE